IDGFKEINDTLGHPTGDRLLVSFASRLSNVVRGDATLLRMGGDEFAVVLPTVTGPVEAEEIARRLLDVLDEPFKLGDRLESVHTSGGLALAETAQDADDLVIRADIALYEAKRQSGTSVAVYDVALESTITRANQLARSLRDAVYDEEFSLVYQPIVTVGTEQVVALEALLRWTSPNLGPVGPDEFIPIAEATGEICAIGRWVLDNACRQLAGWMEAGMADDVTVSINVSAKQLAEPAFVNMVLRAAARWKVPTGRLVIEVTETAALDQTGLARQRLQELKDAGLKISIDDFGSGYSNLGQLISVPFDIIKIDRSLLNTLSAMREQAGGNPSGPCAIMQAIVSIASILDAPVICEGVETEQQRASLQASGITHLQGYLTGRPSPPDVITETVIGSERPVVGSNR
ncbi:MAG: bifunctional diguanylate cyclase/phosphodiesterase, partial [Acidimicrobiia bacterium]|nr:bifunctional diguanylate cyclase/phosphodiesterase [Acidimicrobiia bacterium]